MEEIRALLLFAGLFLAGFEFTAAGAAIAWLAFGHTDNATLLGAAAPWVIASIVFAYLAARYRRRYGDPQE